MGKITYSTSPVWVKPYVKVYYQAHGFDEEEKSFLKILLKSKDSRDDAIYVQQPKGQVEWRIPIPERWHQSGMHTLTVTNARLFAKHLEEKVKAIFENSILGLIHAYNHTDVSIEIQKYLEELRDNEGLDENSLSLDTLKRHIGRFCKSKNIQFKRLKKLRSTVHSKSEQSELKNTPKGYLLLDDWLKDVPITKRWFHKSLKHDLPVKKEHGLLYVRDANAA